MTFFRKSSAVVSVECRQEFRCRAHSLLCQLTRGSPRIPWESEDPMGVRGTHGSPGKLWESEDPVGVRGCELHPELE